MRKFKYIDTQTGNEYNSKVVATWNIYKEAWDGAEDTPEDALDNRIFLTALFPFAFTWVMLEPYNLLGEKRIKKVRI